MKTNEFIDILKSIDIKSEVYFQIEDALYNFKDNIYVSNSFKKNKILLIKSKESIDINNFINLLNDKNQSYQFVFLSEDAKEKYKFIELKLKKRPKETYIILKKD